MTRKLIWALLLIGVLAGLCSLAYPRTQLDASSASYAAITILEGGAPYRDAWDVRAPGLFLAYAVEIFLFGQSAVGLRIFDFLWQGCTALVLFLFARRIHASRETALLASVLYFLAYFSQNSWDWAQPDGLMNLPLVLFLLFASHAMESDRLFHWFLSAVFIGVAALFKLPYGFLGIALIVLACRQALAAPFAILRRLVMQAVGVATPLALCAVFLYARGALGDALLTEFTFAPAYVAHLHQAFTWQRNLRNTLGRPGLVPYFVLFIIALGALVRPRRGGQSSQPGSVGAVVVVFRKRDHHVPQPKLFSPSIPSLVTATGAAECAGVVERHDRLSRAGAERAPEHRRGVCRSVHATDGAGRAACDVYWAGYWGPAGNRPLGQGESVHRGNSLHILCRLLPPCSVTSFAVQLRRTRKKANAAV